MNDQVIRLVSIYRSCTSWHNVEHQIVIIWLHKTKSPATLCKLQNKQFYSSVPLNITIPLQCDDFLVDLSLVYLFSNHPFKVPCCHMARNSQFTSKLVHKQTNHPFIRKRYEGLLHLTQCNLTAIIV